MVSRKFTDEELSVILDAHEQGALEPQADIRNGCVCLLMAACGTGEADNDLSVGWDWSGWEQYFGEDYTDVYEWFDAEYNEQWTTDELLHALEAQGLA